jgi:methionine-rich copper-binding protein CopC
MASKIDFFWELFKSVAGGTGDGITDALDALAKSDRAKLEDYFSNVIDQVSFNTADYNRLRKFFIDLFATHRSLTTQSLKATDPHALTNSDLDELFRSFGYPYSARLRGFDENPLEQKIQFFLDLVNLYKVKGTPQSLVDVLQYYGVTEVDIYEFLLKLNDTDELIFDGKAVAGTSLNANIIQFPYNNLTAGDPHWFYTEQQIRDLNNNLDINLPSQTPYIGVQPAVDLDGPEFSVISRLIQDQYYDWQSSGTPPEQNGDITYTGELGSLLEIYLSSIYMFNSLYNVGVENDRFICYDGTTEVSTDIITEFDNITDPPIRRCDLNDNPFVIDSTSGLYIPSSYCSDSKIVQYYDLFTRNTPTNFLVDENTAGTVLQTLNPTLKAALDSAGEPLEVLYSLLKDLANWIRGNIGFGFVNFGFILFGINEFFNELRPVINFFKPIRARLLLIEALQVKNRLFNTIVVDDKFEYDIDHYIHDFLTGDSTPCCLPDTDTTSNCYVGEVTKCYREFADGADPSINFRSIWENETEYSVNDVVTSSPAGNQYRCIQAHTSVYTTTKPQTGTDWTSFWELYSYLTCDTTSAVNISTHSRDFYDCGSYHDIGAVTDIPQELFIEQHELIQENLRCPAADGTGFVVSELLDIQYELINSELLNEGITEAFISFETVQPSTDYSIAATFRNESGLGSNFDFIVTDKSTTGFRIAFSGTIDRDDYYIDYNVTDSTNSGETFIPLNSDTITIPVSSSCGSNYTVSGVLKNTSDSTTDIFAWTITDKKSTNFTIELSSPVPTANYSIEWFICEGDQTGNQLITNGATNVTVNLPSSLAHDTYPVVANLTTTDSTTYIYSKPIITDKTNTSFTVEFPGSIIGDNYSLSWSIPTDRSPLITSYTYYQTGGFRDFDTGGSFDCTHGFDHVTIEVEDVSNYILQETEEYLLQEDGFRIRL